MEGSTQPAVRAKFKCTEVTQSEVEKGVIGYRAKFEAVIGGSPENDKFFRYTPAAAMTLATIAGDHFVPGKEYYLDFTPADS